MEIIEQMKAVAAAENAAAREAWPGWCESKSGKHGKARPMKLDPAEVRQCLDAGLNNTQIARKFNVSLSTVGYCVRRMEGDA